MRTLALLLAIIGVSAAATIYGMNDQQFQDAMMEAFASNPSAMGAAMGFGTLMGHQSDEPAPEAYADDEGAADRGARATEDKVAIEAHGHNPFGAMMGMMFPEMMFPSHDAPPAPVTANGNKGQVQSDSNGHSISANGNGNSKPANGNGAPYAANGNGASYASNGNGASYASNGNGQVQAPVLSSNGNGHYTPAYGNGFQKPTNGNGYHRPTNGNGNNKGNRPRGAAAASAVSISKGPGAVSSSHSQAYIF